MDDREMLELAAKAMGIKLSRWNSDNQAYRLDRDDGGWWNPLKDDGDCARLEAALSIDITWFDNRVEATCYTEQANFKVIDAAAHYEDFPDKQSARRHASVQVAAEIGKQEGK